MTLEVISANSGIPMGKAQLGGGSTDTTWLYKYRGSVATYSDLLALDTTDFKPGYVYDVQENGMDYSWTGTTWNSLGPINYYTKPETNTLLDEKQDKLISQNAGDGIVIYDYYPDAVETNYQEINSSQQYVPYSVADPTAWVSQYETPRGIAITDTLDNITSKPFEYVALIPYSDGAGISLKLKWDYSSSLISQTDGVYLLPASNDTFITPYRFHIGGAYFKNTNDISITNEQYTQIQEQGGIWFKITSDGNGNYNTYYSLDNSEWVEIIFGDGTKFFPEHTPERPCIGCFYSYNPNATFNLEAASFAFTPARDPYTKIGVAPSVYQLIDSLTARVAALEANINGGNA